MDSKVNYTVVGFFVLALGAILFIVGLWLSTSGDQKQYSNYITIFKESVAGLNAQASVKYNGVDVGYVKGVRLSPHNPNQVEAILAIESDVPITTNTQATLQVKGITGIAYIGLSPKDPKIEGQPISIKAGHRYPQIQVLPSLFFRLDAAIGDATASLKQVSEGVQNLLSDENQRSISLVLTNFATLSETMAQNTNRLAKIINDADVSMTHVAVASKKLPALVDNVNSAAASVTGMSDSVTIAVEGVSGQAVPEVVTTMQQLQTLIINLQQLTQELEQNPSALIRGREPAALGPGE